MSVKKFSKFYMKNELLAISDNSCVPVPNYRQRLLYLSIFCLSLGISIVTEVKAQIPNPIHPVPKQPEVPPFYPEEQYPQVTPPVPITPQEYPDVDKTFTVTGFEFDGNTAFSDEELAKEIGEFKRKISFAQLLQAAAKIQEFYVDNGYITSGAYIPANQTLPESRGIVKIQVVEGSLAGIKIQGNRRLNSNYVRSRIARATIAPLNQKRLEEALQLLQIDPLIEKVSAELSAGTTPGTNLLTVTIKEANAFSLGLTIDNNRNPSVGSFRRSVEINHANLLGFGDGFNIAYSNTDGSNNIEASYTLPINARNGTVRFNYDLTKSNVIEPPFDEVDIEGNYRRYELTLRQPIFQKATQQGTDELALGLTVSRQESEGSVLGVGLPTSAGADENGNTRISAIRFFQEYNQRSRQQVWVARSQFSLGLNAFDATINNKSPDGQFFAWRGQMAYLRLLGPPTADPQLVPKFLLRSDVQLSDRALLPLEQISLGGETTIRGYRQDEIVTDNAFLVSTELQLPVYSTNDRQSVLSVIPFVDFGTAWNSSNQPDPDPNTLLGVGLGLQFVMSDKFKARLDYGLPLISIDSEKRTWQENGIYFSVEYRPF